MAGLEQAGDLPQGGARERAAIGGWRVWWRLARPFSLTASIIPVTVGAAVSIADGSFRSVWLFLAMLVASMLVQVATNMFNEYYDYRRGLDTPESIGIAGAIVGGAMSPIAVFSAAMACFAVALGLGIYLTLNSAPIVFVAGVVCALAGYLYTGGPRPIAYTPFGELEVFMFMGPVMVGLTYFIQAGALSAPALWASVPVACLVAAILLANNLRDRVSDARAGRATVPIVFGRRWAAWTYAGLVGGAFGSVLVAAAAGLLPGAAVLSFVAAPAAPRLLQWAFRLEAAAELDRLVRGSAALHARFGALLTLGIAVGPLLGWRAPGL